MPTMHWPTTPHKTWHTNAVYHSRHLALHIQKKIYSNQLWIKGRLTTDADPYHLPTYTHTDIHIVLVIKLYFEAGKNIYSLTCVFSLPLSLSLPIIHTSGATSYWQYAARRFKHNSQRSKHRCWYCKGQKHKNTILYQEAKTIWTPM